MIAPDSTSEPNDAPVSVAVTWTFAVCNSLSSDDPACDGTTVVKFFPSVSTPVLVWPLWARLMDLTWCASTLDWNCE